MEQTHEASVAVLRSILIDVDQMDANAWVEVLDIFLDGQHALGVMRVTEAVPDHDGPVRGDGDGCCREN